MSPLESALLDPVDAYEDAPAPYSVQLAKQWELDAEKTRSDRRAHKRLRDHELEWLRSARLSAGQKVSVVDLSVGGALLDSPVQLRPDSILTLEIDGRGLYKVVPFRVLRCQIGALEAGRTIYRGACEFTSQIELPIAQPEGARVLYPNQFVGLDLALKQLVERAGPAGAFGALDTAGVRQALESLRDRALKTPLDTMGRPLAALLDRVVPALGHNQGLPDIINRIEIQLRQTVPQARLRLAAVAEPAGPGLKSILINVPGAPAGSALVRIDLPRNVILNAWQSRVLRVTSRLIALLQRLEPDVPVADIRPLSPADSAPAPAPRAAATQAPAAAIAAATPAATAAPSATTVEDKPATRPDDTRHTTAWQKIVVRYREGQILKGYTHDFSAARPQFSLWPTLTASPKERVIVPLARLKGVFFVRDFDGNPGYVERVDDTQPQHGRRIEVTLMDDEVVVGRTLSYRSEGHGFFVVPADPLANNVRIFIVATAVRQVRFP